MADGDSTPEFLTTREVAALLRVRERKVYELASAGQIPCRRVTGKLLFPRVGVEAWIAGPETAAKAPPETTARPNVIAGSHDPLLDWALREAETGLATMFDGSLDGLSHLEAGKAIACGLHVFEPGSKDWNKDHASRSAAGPSSVLMEWAKRRQGLILGNGLAGRISGVGDIAGLRVALRQRKAGSRILFDHLLAEAEMSHADLTIVPATARTETEAATMIASGQADAALGLETAARQFSLGFVPLIFERYDLLIDRRSYFEPPLQRLFAFSRSSGFAAKAEEMGGYDLRDHTRIHWNGG